jgi:F420-dependent methylenetetrahydromethanopterin dehydrogenase
MVVLHVLTADTVPRVLDHPARDEELMGAEFLARNCPVAAGIEVRVGPVASCVLDMCHESDADLVVLSWSQDSSPGHAAVVKEVLERSRAPVLLLPVAAGEKAG